MDRKNTCRSCILSDEGMSLIEIMAAVTILVIVVTAMLPMLLQTTMMSSQAKAQTAITNAVSSYVEEIRALPYDQVAIIGDGDPGASVDATKSVLIEGYTVLMTASISWVDDPDLSGTENYKELAITASATADGKPAITYDTTTYIWGVEGGMSNTDVPLVVFSSSSPSSLEVVWGASVPVGGHAEAVAAGASVSKVVLKVDSEYLPNSATPPSFAEFVSASSPVDVTWLWDTTARSLVTDEYGLPILDGEGNRQYVYFSPDGLRLLKVEAWDSLGLNNYVTRLVLVDNYAPNPVAWASLSVDEGATIGASWAEAMDGTEPAAGYNIRVRKAPSIVMDPAEWSYTTLDIGAVTNAEVAATPFSRYFIEVQSESARGLVDTEAWVASPIVVSRPVLMGATDYTQTISKEASSYFVSTQVVTDVSVPTFAINGEVTYDIWRSTALAGLGTGDPYVSNASYASGTWGETVNDQVAYPKGEITPTYYYLVRATFTPAGETEATAVWTNVAYVPGVVIDSAGQVSGSMVQQW